MNQNLRPQRPAPVARRRRHVLLVDAHPASAIPEALRLQGFDVERITSCRALESRTLFPRPELIVVVNNLNDATALKVASIAVDRWRVVVVLIGQEHGPPIGFNPTEWSILELVAEGSYATIDALAAELHFQPVTVERIIGRLCHRLGVRNRASLIREAFGIGLLVSHGRGSRRNDH